MRTVMRAVLVAVLMLGARMVEAQVTVTNPTKVQFNVSVDHAAVVSGVAVVDTYRLATHLFTTSIGPLAFTRDIPKAQVVPNASGVATVTISEFISLASGTYQATLTVLGPGGVSDPVTAPFAAITKPRPASGLVLVQ